MFYISLGKMYILLLLYLAIGMISHISEFQGPIVQSLFGVNARLNAPPTSFPSIFQRINLL